MRPRIAASARERSTEIRKKAPRPTATQAQVLMRAFRSACTAWPSVQVGPQPLSLPCSQTLSVGPGCKEGAAGSASYECGANRQDLRALAARRARADAADAGQIHRKLSANPERRAEPYDVKMLTPTSTTFRTVIAAIAQVSRSSVRACRSEARRCSSWRYHSRPTAVFSAVSLYCRRSSASLRPSSSSIFRATACLLASVWAPIGHRRHLLLSRGAEI
jgi:hypothetical protein